MVVATMPGDGAVANVSANGAPAAVAHALKRAISASISLLSR